MKSDFSSLLPIRATDTIILDTDICTDCDDCGAMAVLIQGSKSTGAKLGAVINNVDQMQGCGAIDAILSYYNVEAPIGLTGDRGFYSNVKSRYTLELAEKFSSAYRNGTLAVQPSLKLYRETLKAADDKSVVLITVGFLNAAAEILAAEPALFEKKVRCVVSMAGNFQDLSYCEYNIVKHVPAAQAFYSACPVPVFFHGWEIGIRMKTGFPVAIPDHPVSFAYELHSNGYNNSFDPAAVDFAFRGVGKDWVLSDPFMVQVQNDGSLALQYGENGLHTFVKFADDSAPDRIRYRLDSCYSARP